MTAVLGCWIPGCSSTPVEPPPPLPEVPTYTKVPHPDGYDLSDIHAIFLTPGAPKREELKSCDGDYQKLKARTQSREEISQGARELVVDKPVEYHWCFYSKVLEAEEQIKSKPFIEEKQRSVLEIYSFLAPISRAFKVELKDPRYLRWAAFHYKQVSKNVFYRPLKLSPKGTAELLDGAVEEPYGFMREQKTTRLSVLEKYGLKKGVIEESSSLSATPVPQAALMPTVESAQLTPLSNEGAQQEPAKEKKSLSPSPTESSNEVASQSAVDVDAGQVRLEDVRSQPAASQEISSGTPLTQEVAPSASAQPVSELSSATPAAPSSTPPPAGTPGPMPASASGASATDLTQPATEDFTPIPVEN